MVRAQRRLLRLHRSYLQRLVKAHEEERSRIAREVHDDAVQRLVHVGRELDQYQDEYARPSAERHRLTGIRGEVDDLATALRHLAHQLHPAALEQAGLNLALSQLAEETQRLHGLKLALELPARELELHPDARLALFRIAQEALRNIVRHAHAGTASLRLGSGDGVVEMTVQDSGAGFDSAGQRSGLGLVGIEERARLAGGAARIASAPGHGTRVTVRLPSTVNVT